MGRDADTSTCDKSSGWIYGFVVSHDGRHEKLEPWDERASHQIDAVPFGAHSSDDHRWAGKQKEEVAKQTLGPVWIHLNHRSENTEEWLAKRRGSEAMKKLTVSRLTAIDIPQKKLPHA